ncbi:MAG TPA: sugar transferase [Coriobacteriia bacterium]|nr:sugar transferase [Coriobacteriia bacterium]
MPELSREEQWVATGGAARQSRSGSVASAVLASAKRGFDLFGSLLGVALISPLLATIALLIRIDSPGPVLFRQTRVGRGGTQFEMFKFRTMRSDCDSEQHREYVTRMIREGGDELRNGQGTYKLENDPRITRVGRVLRRLSFDELPQLFNVARGEMSLVGPRPPLPYEVELYTDRHMRRLEAMPGMTGLWQVSGRNQTTFEQMVDLDLSYIEHWSPLLDLKIIGRTVIVLLTERGA